jgi:Uma2 family endonuclease
MSQPARALAPLPFELVFSDGEPLESEWHTYQFPFLRDLIGQAMAEQGRDDFYAGGNMFVYYSYQQAEDVVKGKKYFRGPDVFWVGGVKPGYRDGWVSWEEGGRLPDVIVELLSPSTAHIDRKDKRKLYAEVFHTAEYYLYDPDTRELEGLRLKGMAYQPMAPDEKGRFWSDQLGVFLGLWHGNVGRCKDQDWVRLFRPDGSLVPTEAEAERQSAEAKRQRAEAAEAENARLRALLAERGLS